MEKITEVEKKTIKYFTCLDTDKNLYKVETLDGMTFSKSALLIWELCHHKNKYKIFSFVFAPSCEKEKAVVLDFANHLKHIGKKIYWHGEKNKGENFFVYRCSIKM